MPTFVFSLEVLLEQRRREEEAVQRQMADVRRGREEILRQVRGAQQTIDEQNKLLATEKLVGRLDLTFIGQEKRYVGVLQVFMAQNLQRLAQSEHALQAVRQQLMEAVKRRRMLEKLREKQETRWRQRQQHSQQQMLDELTMQRVRAPAQ